jgi:hypothetical protein
MFTEFLARAYVPHLALAIVAVAVCAFPHPIWPDEGWAKQYEYLDWRYQRFLKRSADARPGSPEDRNAREEWRRECQLAEQVDARIRDGRAPVYASLLLRTTILTTLTALCYVLTDSLVSSGTTMLLPHGLSYLLLACSAFVGAFVTSLAARADAGFAAGQFLLVDGLAVTWLLAARNAHGAFERAHRDAALYREERRAELRGGTAAARLEAEQYFVAHRQLLRKAVPEALWRASINAAIPSDSQPAQAWAAARKLIQKLMPLIAQAEELSRLEEERAKAETTAPAGPDPVKLARAAYEQTLKDVIASLRMGLSPNEIADALEPTLAGASAPVVMTSDDFNKV